MERVGGDDVGRERAATRAVSGGEGGRPVARPGNLLWIAKKVGERDGSPVVAAAGQRSVAIERERSGLLIAVVGLVKLDHCDGGLGPACG